MPYEDGLLHCAPPLCPLGHWYPITAASLGGATTACVPCPVDTYLNGYACAACPLVSWRALNGELQLGISAR